MLLLAVTTVYSRAPPFFNGAIRKFCTAKLTFVRDFAKKKNTFHYRSLDFQAANNNSLFASSSLLNAFYFPLSAIKKASQRLRNGGNLQSRTSARASIKFMKVE